MTDFEKRYLTVANTPDAPDCTPEFAEELRGRLISGAPALEPISYPVLASLAVAARRPDIVHHLFEAAISHAQEDEEIIHTYHQFSSAIITILPSIGGPWCNPAMMSLAEILQSRNFGPVDRLSNRNGIKTSISIHFSALSLRPPLGEADVSAGNDLLNNRYTATKDPNVQQLLSTYCPDFDNMTRTVALGYCHVGTTNTGVFKEHQTELMLAAALAGAGATRSATVHGKTALALGNSPEAVRAVYKLAEEINHWNRMPYQPVDLEQLFADMGL